MAHSLIVTPGTELDIFEIAEWYETEKDGLGLEFIDRSEVELQRIVFTKRFPYGIHYTFEKETVFVHAVMHTRRKPRIYRLSPLWKY